MLLSQPVSQRALVLGKAGARWGVLGTATILLLLLGLGLSQTWPTTAVEWTHLALTAGLLLSWGAFWFAAAIAVNSRRGTSARNALLLTGAWLLLVVLIPGGVGVAVNMLGSAHRDYLAAGGLGAFLGDGALNYGRERILEVFYRFQPVKHLWISPDFQYIRNPGYNRDRGPAMFYGVRLHAEF